MFVAMKRMVLQPGWLRARFFVSQTPELTAMADAVIDLDAMALIAEQAAQDAGALSVAEGARPGT